MKSNLIPIVLVIVGGAFVYAAMKGQSPIAVVKGILTNGTPPTATPATPAPPGTTGGTGATRTGNAAEGAAANAARTPSAGGGRPNQAR